LTKKTFLIANFPQQSRSLYLFHFIGTHFAPLSFDDSIYAITMHD